MRRSRVVLMSSFAIVALFVITGYGQTRTARTLVVNSGPTAIEGSLSPDTSHAPGSPEMRRRRRGQPMARAGERVSASGARYVAGRVIVKFKDTVSAAGRVSAMSSVSRTATMPARPAYQNFDVVQTAAGEDAESMARAFRARPDVEYAQASYRVSPQQASDHFVPNDRFYPLQWDLPLIDMERAWAVQSAAGSAITIAVLDTGIAFKAATINYTGQAFCTDSLGNLAVGACPQGSGFNQFPALGSINLAFVAATELQPLSRFVAPMDFIWNDQLPVDLNGHGTHVSGTLGQLTNNGANGQGDVANGGGTAGVAFNVKLMPVKVLSTEWDDIFGSPAQGTDDVVARGIRYAADNGAKVINMSLGRTGPSGCGANPNQDGCAPVIEDALKYAVCTGAKTSTCSGAGVFIAIAAGNDFEDGNPIEVIAEAASRVAGAVSVAAVTTSKGHASYSSTGSYIELAAPGGDSGICSLTSSSFVIQQTLNLDLVDTFNVAVWQFTAPRFDALSYFCFAGTSQAAPHVAGVAAMLMQQGITNPAAVEAALKRFATPCDVTRNTCDASAAAGHTDTFGSGLVQARNTLRGLGLAK